ncbi:MAG: TIGR02996 domain-containing protein [Proteobacteria bacterium]|nr:TIGR02996 domain-containing protein [Pseudomonadota bacterium]
MASGSRRRRSRTARTRPRRPPAPTRSGRAAWQARPSTRISDLVARIDAQLPRETIEGATVAEREATWERLADRRDPADLSKLLHAPWPPHANVATIRVRWLEQWPPSPRITHLLLALGERAELAGRSMHTLLRRIVRLALAQDDPAVTRFLARVAETGTPAMQLALRATLARKQRPLEPTFAADEAAALAALEATFVVRDRGTRDALLAAIYAAPQDDGPREVYADVLVEDHDPRGELIALQLKRARGDRGTRAREQALLREAGRAWFDGLDRESATDVELRRGFPARARVRQAVLSSPAWATVETLLVDAAFVGGPSLRGLRKLCGVFADQLERIALPNPELDLLAVVGARLDARTALAPTTLALRSPRGNRAWLDEVARSLEDLAKLPLGRRATTLALDGTVDQLPAGLDAMARAPQLTRLELSTWATEDRPPLRWSVMFDAPRGHLVLAWHGRDDLDTFVALPTPLRRLSAQHVGRIRSLEVVAPPRLEPTYVALTRDKVRALVDKWPAMIAARILL